MRTINLNIRLFFIILLLLSLVGTALAMSNASHNVFLPLVMRPFQPTITATATVTATTTVTTQPSPTVTKSPTITASHSPAILKITHIESDPPGEDLSGEYVTIQNQGGSPATLTGWTLSDNDSHIFTFPSYALQAGASVKVWSKSGTNTTTDLYWGSSQSIWTNTGDCATLKNGGQVVNQMCY